MAWCLSRRCVGDKAFSHGRMLLPLLIAAQARLQSISESASALARNISIVTAESAAQGKGVARMRMAKSIAYLK